MTSRLKPVDLLILGPIISLPWMFAGVELWSFRTAALSLIAGAAWVLWNEGCAGVGLDRRSLRWLLPAFLLAALAAAQLVPLPAGLQRVLNPRVGAAWDEVASAVEADGEDPLRAFERRALARAGNDRSSGELPDFPLDADVEGFRDWYPSSLYPAATAEALAWYVALLAAFLAVRGRCRSREVRRIYIGAIVASLVGIAMIALIQNAEWSGSFYGLRRYIGSTVPFGPYVNRNHFSGAMELAVPALIGIGWSVSASAIGRRGRSMGPGVLAFGGALLCFGAAAVAASKSGAVILPITVTALLLLGARGRRQRGIALILVAVVLLGAVGVMSVTEVGERMRSHLDRSEVGVNTAGRSGAWLATLSIVADYPVMGIGFGAFSEVYPSYQPPGVSKRFSSAHSDYLEVAAEGGLIAFLLLAWLALGYGARVFRSLSSRKAPRCRLGIALGVAALAAHAVVDFNHQIPANALLFVALAALALPAVPPSLADHRPQRRVLLPLTCVLLAVYGVRAFDGTLAGVAHAKAVVLENRHWHGRTPRFFLLGAKGSYRARGLADAAEEHLKTFDRARRRGLQLDEADRHDLDRASRYYVLMHRESPASARSLEGLAYVYERLQDLEIAADIPDQAGAAGVVAEGLHRLASDRAPNWFVPRDRLAMMQWRHGSPEEALEAVRASARVLPSFRPHQYRRLKPIPLEFREAFAEGAWETMQAEPRLRSALFLLALAEQERLLERYDRALDVLDLMEEGGADARQRAHAAHIRGRAFYGLGRYDEARESFEEARQDAVFESFALMELARVAEAQGRDEEAMEIRSSLRWKAPDLPAPALDYAASLRESGNLEPALATVRLVVGNHPDALRGRAMLVDLLLRMGELDEAEVEIVEMESREMNPSAGQLRARLDREREIASER